MSWHESAYLKCVSERTQPFNFVVAPNQHLQDLLFTPNHMPGWYPKSTSTCQSLRCDTIYIIATKENAAVYISVQNKTGCHRMRLSQLTTRSRQSQVMNWDCETCSVSNSADLQSTGYQHFNFLLFLALSKCFFILFFRLNHKIHLAKTVSPLANQCFVMGHFFLCE